MQESMDMLKDVRMEKGIFIDQENDPNETGLVGSQFSLITTDEGDLDAKLTTLDPNFAAAMVELLTRANLTSGDTIALMLTGSMPGANMAMLIACKAMDIYPFIISFFCFSKFSLLLKLRKKCNTSQAFFSFILTYFFKYFYNLCNYRFIFTSPRYIFSTFFYMVFN